MAFVEIGKSPDGEAFTLSDALYTIGSDPTAAKLVIDDPCVSGLHAVLERLPSGWVIRDLGSRNETKVNRDRLIETFRFLREGDEIILGRTRLVFREPKRKRGDRDAGVQCASCGAQYIAGTVLCPECLGTELRPIGRSTMAEASTERLAQPVRLTVREHRVLVEFGRYLRSGQGDAVTIRAIVHEIAERLLVSDAEIEQNLRSLFEIFGVDHKGTFESRCVRLAEKLSEQRGDDEGGSGDREPRNPPPPRNGPGTSLSFPEN